MAGTKLSQLERTLGKVQKRVAAAIKEPGVTTDGSVNLLKFHDALSNLYPSSAGGTMSDELVTGAAHEFLGLHPDVQNVSDTWVKERLDLQSSLVDLTGDNRVLDENEIRDPANRHFFGNRAQLWLVWAAAEEQNGL